jgi:hypothetical protein
MYVGVPITTFELAAADVSKRIFEIPKSRSFTRGPAAVSAM